MNRKEKANKVPIWKKWWFWAIIVVIAIMGSGKNTESQENVQTVVVTESIETKKTEPTNNSTEDTNSQKHIYDNAIIKDVMNGFRSEKIGEYSIVKIQSDQVTKENLADWYFNYVEKNDFNWNMLLYTDKKNEGVYAITGTISKDVMFDIDEYGDYSLEDCSKCITYVPDEKGTLKEIYSAENNYEVLEDISTNDFVENIKFAIQGDVGENEKIIDIKYENENLYIYVDFSKVNPSPFTFEDLAVSRTCSITDSILELKEYDSLWNNIIVDFGEIGYIKNDKGNIKYNEVGRYFDESNFKIE